MWSVEYREDPTLPVFYSVLEVKIYILSGCVLEGAISVTGARIKEYILIIMIYYVIMCVISGKVV